MADELMTEGGIPTAQRGIASAVNETYNYSNSSLFGGMLPAYYKDYYWRYLRPAIQWLDGYVLSLHGDGSGIISTRIGSNLLVDSQNR